MSLGGAKACLTIALRYAATRLTGLTPDMFLIYLCVCFSVLVTVSGYLYFSSTLSVVNIASKVKAW